MKKLFLSCLLAFAVGASGVSSYFASADGTASSADEPQTGTETTSEVQISTQREFRQLTADELIYEMGAGWNLGNTLESHNNTVPNESAWGAPYTTKEMLEAVHDQGYNSVRIPVTWGTMIGEAPDYEIDPTWLSRVQDVVDYAISLDMYVLVNMHHDGAENMYWLNLGADEEDWNGIVEKYAGLWTNIAEHFKDYDEHLMFESLNEIQAAVSTQQDTTRINELNQTFVDSIRQTGGNNSQRWLAVASGYAQIHNFNSYWEMPTDEYCSVDTNRLMVKAHNYPRQNVDDSSSNSIKTALTEFRNVINEKAAARGITEKVPCLLTEFGNKTENKEHDPRVDQYGKTYLIGHMNDIVCFFWDTPGAYADAQGGSYTVFDRLLLSPDERSQPTWNAMLRAVYEEPTDAYLAGDYSAYTGSPEIIAATSITLSETSIELGINEQATVTATMDEGAEHDIVLWTSSDDDVATVTRGIVRGRSAGVTTITAYSLEDSSVTATLTVKVTGEKTGDSAASLSVLEETTYEDGEYIFVEYGSYVNLTVCAPEETSDIITFETSNEDVATVNAVGKVTAIYTGSATITIMASGGACITVKVVVGEPSAVTSLELTVVANYNYDSGGVMYADPVPGETITVTGDGTYSITLDLTQHRPDDMPSVITSLDYVNVIYIVDEAVRTGAASSPVSNGYIKYESISISDGTTSAEMALRNDDRMDEEGWRAVIKEGSASFDTEGPINGWNNDRDMAVEAEGNYTLNLRSGWSPEIIWEAVEHPTSITIEFTLRDMEFTSSEVDPGTPAESLLSDVEKAEVSVGGSTELGVMVSPADTTSSVSFSSSDSTVAMVANTKGVALDESGFATMQVYGVGAGTATITARTDNGLTTTYEVTVIDENAPLPDADENGIPDQLQQWRLYYTSANWVNVSGAVVELNGDGTYTFTISNIDLSAGLKTFYLQDATAINTGKAEYYNAIPADGVEIRVVGFKVGDTDVMDGVDADHSEFFNLDPASDGGYFDFSIINAWYAPGVVVGEPYFVHDGVETFFADDSIASATSMEVTLEIRGLGTPVALADKAALQTRFDELEDTSSDGYTTDSFAAFETALTNAETVLDDLLATQEEVDGALAALNTAYEGLTLAVDKTALQTRYDELKDISSEDYTSGTFAAFETALTNAETILADAEATQEEVDGALSALNAAYEGLAEAADKAALQTRYDELKDTSSEGYTSDSFTAFETALDNAETILADTEATQEEVDAALSALNTAYEELAIEVPEPGPDDSSTADSSTSDSSTSDSSTSDSSTADSSAGGGSTTSSDEEGGCGSTITAAGVVIAVISIGLGAILTLRKRSER